MRYQFLIHVFNGKLDTIDRLTELGLDQVVLSAITVIELYQGMGNKTEMAKMKRKLKYYDVIEIDTRISNLATILIEKYKLSHGLQIPDAIIGATALFIKSRFLPTISKILILSQASS